jgi:hypothetical protein
MSVFALGPERQPPTFFVLLQNNIISARLSLTELEVNLTGALRCANNDPPEQGDPKNRLALAGHGKPEPGLVKSKGQPKREATALTGLAFRL